MNIRHSCSFCILVLLLATGCASSREYRELKARNHEYRELEALRRDSADLLAGRWGVQFANGVKEICEVHKDGFASVFEPRRNSTGTVEYKVGSFVILYRDERIERWTSVGKQFVVEHWPPGYSFPSGTPVLGVAERLR